MTDALLASRWESLRREHSHLAGRHDTSGITEVAHRARDGDREARCLVEADLRYLHEAGHVRERPFQPIPDEGGRHLPPSGPYLAVETPLWGEELICVLDVRCGRSLDDLDLFLPPELCRDDEGRLILRVTAVSYGGKRQIIDIDAAQLAAWFYGPGRVVLAENKAGTSSAAVAADHEHAHSPSNLDLVDQLVARR